jgi:hypothetical protein
MAESVVLEGARTAHSVVQRLLDPVTEQVVAGMSDIRIRRPLEVIEDTKSAADATTKLLARDERGQPACVVLCALRGPADLVARGVERAAEAKVRLGEPLGQVILDPIDWGHIEELTYAIMPYCRPLSSKWLIGRFQARRLRQSLLEWIRDVTKQTLADIAPDTLERAIASPLRHLLSREDLRADARLAARNALTRLEAGRWVPRHVLMHNDLWIGNILVDAADATQRRDRPWRERFVIVDWAGSRIDGYGIYDLLRLARSLRLGARALHAELRHHARALGCARADVASHLAAALGHLGMNLECFPPDRYARTVDGCFKMLGSLDG